MKTMIRFLSVVVLILAFSVAGMAQATYDYDKSVDFTQYKTYSFLGWQDDSDTIINSLDKQTILDAVQHEFEERGMQYVNEGGEMMVSLYIVIKQEKQLEAYTNYTGGYGMGPWGYGYGGMVGGTANTTVNTVTYDMGTLVLDCFDEKSKKLIFEGIYKGEVEEKAQKRDKTIPKHIAAMMKNYPVKPVN
jgi:hypothetical protein